MTARHRRVHPWLRAALVLYLIGAVLVIAAHQHRDALQSHDCTLCAVAHAPSALPANPVFVAPPFPSDGTCPVPRSLAHESAAARTHSSRAPPQA